MTNVEWRQIKFTNSRTNFLSSFSLLLQGFFEAPTQREIPVTTAGCWRHGGRWRLQVTTRSSFLSLLMHIPLLVSSHGNWRPAPGATCGPQLWLPMATLPLRDRTFPSGPSHWPGTSTA